MRAPGPSDPDGPKLLKTGAAAHGQDANGLNQGSVYYYVGRGVKGVSDPLSIFLPPSLWFLWFNLAVTYRLYHHFGTPDPLTIWTPGLNWNEFQKRFSGGPKSGLNQAEVAARWRGYSAELRRGVGPDEALLKYAAPDSAPPLAHDEHQRAAAPAGQEGMH